MGADGVRHHREWEGMCWSTMNSGGCSAHDLYPRFLHVIMAFVQKIVYLFVVIMLYVSFLIVFVSLL